MTEFDKPADVDDLPPGVRLFPLAGVVLLPGGELPLHVFEPRYRAMVVDSLASDRMIAMIQPREDAAQPERPELYRVGTLGHIAQCQETGDGRFWITLRGVSRFRIERELLADTLYRQAEVSYPSFATDVQPATELSLERRRRLEAALRTYTNRLNFQSNWDSIQHAADAVLVGALCMVLPFRPAERQALLEAVDLDARAKMLMTLMQLAGDGPQSDSIQ